MSAQHRAIADALFNAIEAAVQTAVPTAQVLRTGFPVDSIEETPAVNFVEPSARRVGPTPINCRAPWESGLEIIVHDKPAQFARADAMAQAAHTAIQSQRMALHNTQHVKDITYDQAPASQGNEGESGIVERYFYTIAFDKDDASV